MIVNVAPNVTVEIFQSVRYQPEKGYVNNDVLGYSACMYSIGMNRLWTVGDGLSA